VKRFSDFASGAETMTGDKIKIDEVIDKEIEILGFKIKDSKIKAGTKVLTLKFKLDNKERVLFTGSSVLLDQAEKYKEEMPFITTIKKVDKFYTFS